MSNKRKGNPWALLPILVALSIPTGLLIAMLADQVLKRLP